MGMMENSQTELGENPMVELANAAKNVNFGKKAPKAPKAPKAAGPKGAAALLAGVSHQAGVMKAAVTKAKAMMQLLAEQAAEIESAEHNDEVEVQRLADELN